MKQIILVLALLVAYAFPIAPEAAQPEGAAPVLWQAVLLCDKEGVPEAVGVEVLVPSSDWEGDGV